MGSVGAHSNGFISKNQRARSDLRFDVPMKPAVDDHRERMVSASSETTVEDLLNAWFIQIARLVWGKKFAAVFPVKDTATGKVTRTGQGTDASVVVKWAW